MRPLGATLWTGDFPMTYRLQIRNLYVIGKPGASMLGPMPGRRGSDLEPRRQPCSRNPAIKPFRHNRSRPLRASQTPRTRGATWTSQRPLQSACAGDGHGSFCDHGPACDRVSRCGERPRGRPLGRLVRDRGHPLLKPSTRFIGYGPRMSCEALLRGFPGLGTRSR